MILKASAANGSVVGGVALDGVAVLALAAR